MSVRSIGPSADLSAYALADHVPQFVSAQPMLVSEVMAQFPAGPAYLGKMAHVTDLFGSVDESLRCCASGPLGSRVYYWRPTRTDYSGLSAVTGGSMLLSPLFTPPMVFLTGTLSSALTVTPSPLYAWPGCTFEVVSQGILGLFGATLGSVIGSSVSLVTGGSKLVTYDGSAWRVRP